MYWSWQALHADCIAYDSIITPRAFHTSWLINAIDYLQHWWHEGITVLLQANLQAHTSERGSIKRRQNKMLNSLNFPFLLPAAAIRVKGTCISLKQVFIYWDSILSYQQPHGLISVSSNCFLCFQLLVQWNKELTTLFWHFAWAYCSGL